MTVTDHLCWLKWALKAVAMVGGTGCWKLEENGVLFEANGGHVATAALVRASKLKGNW